MLDRRDSRPESPAAGLPGTVQLHAPRRVLARALALLLLLALAAAGIGFWLGWRRPLGTAVAVVLKTDEGRLGRSVAKPGPYGEIICQRSVMELPPEQLPVRYYQTEKLRWFFKGFTVEHLREFWAGPGLAPSGRDRLLQTNAWRIDPGGIWLEPPDDVVLSFSPESRKRIYSVLAKFKENEPQREPFHWPSADWESLFAGAEISAATRAQFERLCYRNGQTVLFADLQVLLRRLPDAAQRAGLMKMLTRRSVMFASLRVSPRTDIRALMAWWKPPGARMEESAVLKAAASLPQGRELSLAAVLPAGPRALLFTFPLPGNAPQPNCHWTAFNFFKEKPDPPTLDDEFWRQKLKQDYAPVSGAPRFGDILLLSREGDEFLHTCVFLADELVYTKNGVSHWAPWQIATINDLLDFYRWDMDPGQPLRMIYYRLKADG